MKISASQIAAGMLAVLMWSLGVLCILPALLMLAGTFWHEGHPSLAHLAAAFSDMARLRQLFSTSVIVAVGSVGTSLAVGVPTGFLCFRTNLPLRRGIILACLLASCAPLYVTATCWMALFGMHFWLYSPWGAAWITGIAYTPLVTLVTGMAFAGSDRELEDAATMDTGRCGVFWHASLPAGSWGIGVAALTVTILSLWDISVTDILMVRTFSEEVFTQFQLGAGPWNAAAISLPVILLLGVLWLMIGRFVGERGEGTLWGKAQPPRVLDIGPMRHVLGVLVGLVVVAFFLVPACALIGTVGSVTNLITAWRTSECELLGTLRVTPVAATIALILAIPAAWTLTRGRYTRWPLLVGLLLLISVPAPIIGIGLIKLLNHEGISGAIYDSEAGLVLAYVIRAIPFAVLALWPAMKAIPREAEEVAVLDGGSWLMKFRSVILPATWRTIIVAWFLAFVLAVTDMGASFLVAPPGRATLSTRFFTLIHYGVYPDAAGICLILMGLVGLAAAIMAGFLWPIVMRDRGDETMELDRT